MAATREAWGKPPVGGSVTTVDPERTRRKRDPGRCFRRAGFVELPDRTKDRGLVILYLAPSAHPEPVQAIHTQLAMAVASPVWSASTEIGSASAEWSRVTQIAFKLEPPRGRPLVVRAAEDRRVLRSDRDWSITPRGIVSSNGWSLVQGHIGRERNGWAAVAPDGVAEWWAPDLVTAMERAEGS